MKELHRTQVTIVGLGLMGGSLAGALRGRCRSIVGLDRRPEAVEEALARGLLDRGTTDMEAAVHQAGIVVLATPVRTILRLLDTLGPLLPADCLLMDLGSTKREIVAKMAQLPDHVQPLGGHPMCGKERSGIEAADPELYRGRTFILSPLPRTSTQALSLGRTLTRAVGSIPLVLEAERQDFLAGTVSHLPYLLACALVSTADATTSKDPAVWEIVAGGFRDTSRVSAGNVTMWMDILMTNREQVRKAVAVYQKKLSDLVQLIASEDEAGLQAFLGDVRAKRLEMFP
jgi:prephenate dehydrogenase